MAPSAVSASQECPGLLPTFVDSHLYYQKIDPYYVKNSLNFMMSYDSGHMVRVSERREFGNVVPKKKFEP